MENELFYQILQIITISKYNKNSIKYQDVIRPTFNQILNDYSLYFRASH